MKLYHKIILAIVALAISFGIGYYTTPTKIEEKLVVKTETVKVEGKTRVVYKEKITKPDGTITEKEYEKEDTNSREESKTLVESQKSSEKDTGVVVGALIYTNTKELTNGVDYGIMTSKRVLGAVNLIGSAIIEKDSNVKIGVGLGWSF